MHIIYLGMATLLVATIPTRGRTNEVRVASAAVAIEQPAQTVAAPFGHSPVLRGAAAFRQTVFSEGLQVRLPPNLEVTAALMTKEQRMQNAWRTAQSLKHLAVPPAVQVTEFIGTGYTEGKFGFLEVLGAKRILFKGALREVHVSQAEFERLRGQEAGLSTTGSAR